MTSIEGTIPELYPNGLTEIFEIIIQGYCNIFIKPTTLSDKVHLHSYDGHLTDFFKDISTAKVGILSISLDSINIIRILSVINLNLLELDIILNGDTDTDIIPYLKKLKIPELCISYVLPDDEPEWHRFSDQYSISNIDCIRADIASQTMVFNNYGIGNNHYGHTFTTEYKINRSIYCSANEHCKKLKLPELGDGRWDSKGEPLESGLFNELSNEVLVKIFSMLFPDISSIEASHTCRRLRDCVHCDYTTWLKYDSTDMRTTFRNAYHSTIKS